MWKPSANIKTLKKRAEIINQIRTFFLSRDFLEVETPLLSQATITDPHIHSIKTEQGYLQTSPEFAMKRLLAADSGPIFQICKAFRDDEQGSQHNPEFTMLEWYRPGFDHHQLMDEMDELLQEVLKSKTAERKTYQSIFKEYLNIDPLEAGLASLKACAAENKLNIEFELDKDGWLNLLMSHLIESKLGIEKPIFIYDYPSSQSALAKVSLDDPRIAHRFEVYIKGTELANGFYELTYAKEQRQRFENDLKKREAQNLPKVTIDENFLSALEHGLPECAGVALGVDRLMMLSLKKQSINEVLSFDFNRA